MQTRQERGVFRHCTSQALVLVPAFQFQLYHSQSGFRDFLRCLGVQGIKLFPPEK